MKLNGTEKSKFLTMAVILLLGIFSMTLLAQNKEESKLDQLKGKVEKITFKVDGKDVVFEGKDAEKLADKVKSEKRIEIITDDNAKSSGKGEKKIVIVKSKKGANESAFETKNDGNETKVNVEVNDGKKVITVTTVKDGKEETKTYEGEEAEKFLKDQKEMKDISVYVTDGEKMEKGNVFFFKNKMKAGKGGMSCGCGCCCGEGCGMKETKEPGMEKHKMMMKMKEGNCDSKMMLEKKIEKKEESKSDKK